MAKFFYESTRNKDARYIVGMDIPDPFFFLDTGSQKYIFLDRREYGVFQGKKSSIFPVALEPLLERAQKEIAPGTRLQKLAFLILRDYEADTQEIEVPVRFPLPLADYLREQGVHLVSTSPFYPERARKTEEEVRAIREVIQKTEKAFSLIQRILAESRISGNEISWKNNLLTSEILKKEVAVLFAQEGLVSEEGIIISSGRQSAIPHHGGEGPILPHAPIVCDIFPKSVETGYFADISRTFCKGEPSGDLQRIYDAVLKAQLAGLKQVHAGKKASQVHAACWDVLKEEKLEHLFVHATGHGVGLEVHESPTLSSQSEDVLAAGNAITLEPGVYDSEKGGVRIEDMALVTEHGGEVLSSYPTHDWIIP